MKLLWEELNSTCLTHCVCQSRWRSVGPSSVLPLRLHRLSLAFWFSNTWDQFITERNQKGRLCVGFRLLSSRGWTMLLTGLQRLDLTELWYESPLSCALRDSSRWAWYGSHWRQLRWLWSLTPDWPSFHYSLPWFTPWWVRIVVLKEGSTSVASFEGLGVASLQCKRKGKID